MGYALVNTQTSLVLSWTAWGEPTPGANELVVEVDSLSADRELLRWDGAGGLRAATQQELDDATDSLSVSLRDTAVEMLTSIDPSPKLLRALMLVLLDEMNLHAAKMNAILNAIDSGSTLAQVKSNIAAIADYPNRSAAQLKTSITNKINAGDADS